MKSVKQMTQKEYYDYRLEMTRRELMALIAKFEAPYGDEISEILYEAGDRIEILQQEED